MEIVIKKSQLAMTKNEYGFQDKVWKSTQLNQQEINDLSDNKKEILKFFLKHQEIINCRFWYFFDISIPNNCGDPARRPNKLKKWDYATYKSEIDYMEKSFTGIYIPYVCAYDFETRELVLFNRSEYDTVMPVEIRTIMFDMEL